MADILSRVSEELGEDAATGKIADVIHKLVTRRQFMRGAGAVGLGATTFCLFGCGSSSTAANEAPRQVFVANSLGMIVAEPSRCGGCRRCELACTEFNDGIAQPSAARIKVGRNYNLGSIEAGQGFKGGGIWGNFRTPQDTCRQCAHPVPCQLVCPHDAIEVIAPVNARVVNVDKCVGCGICTQACPWGMTSVNGPVLGSYTDLNGQVIKTKATKCTLCGGNPECVAACPTGAIKYVPWADKTKEVPARIVVPAHIQSAVADSCAKCH